MEKLRVKASFCLFFPLDSQGFVRSDISEQNFGFVTDTHCGRLLFSIKLFCKQRVTSQEYEQPDCLCWATKAPLTFRKRTDEEQQSGFLLRLKVKQGAFDFRKTKKRFIRLQIECRNSDGHLLNTGTSQFFQLLPRKRNGNIFEEDHLRLIPTLQWRNKNIIGNPRLASMSTPSTFTDEEFSAATPYNRDVGTPLITGASVSNSPISSDESSGNISLRDVKCEPVTHVKTVDEYGSYDSRSSYESDNVLHSYDSQFAQIPADELHELSPVHSTNATLPRKRKAHYEEQYEVLHHGNAEVTGNFRALNFYKASDINIKEDIKLLAEGRNPRSVLLQIDGVSYKFKPGTTHSTQRRFVGYIAQQIESVVPEAVQLIDGILHVDYESLIPYLSESIKQNYSDIQSLKSEVYYLKLIIAIFITVAIIVGLRFVIN